MNELEIKRQRQEEDKLAEENSFEDFKEKLSQTNTIDEALALADSGPSTGQPGSKPYARLRFFLGGLVVPLTASKEEKMAYADLINRVKRELSQETVTKVIAELKESL